MKTKKKLADLSVDEFLADGLSCSDSSDGEQKGFNVMSKKQVLKRKKAENVSKAKEINGKKRKESEISATSQNKGEKLKSDASAKHKSMMDKVKESDPEFYEFLKNEDQSLLDFDESDNDKDDDKEDNDESDDAMDFIDEDDDDDDDEFPSSESENEEKQKKNSGSKKTLEDNDDAQDMDDDSSGNSEEAAVSDMSSEDEQPKPKKRKTKPQKSNKVTDQMITQWTADLQANKPEVIKNVVQAFRAAVKQAGGASSENSAYKVEGSENFNAIIRLCLSEFPAMLSRYVVVSKSKDPKRPILPLYSKQWNIIQKDMLLYLGDLIELLSQLSESKILSVVLRHVSQMIPYYASNPKLNKAILKKLISLWCTGSETVRILSFLSIVRLTRLRQETFLAYVLKQMYISYIRNCKFTSPTTLPLINFMQRSLVEIFSINQELTYQYAFVYIRQLAIHLRNAITIKKKDTCQAVYNWQYMHALNFWARTLSTLYPSETLEPLIYPLVQTIIGTIMLIPAAKYFPLRFHCVKMLNLLSKSTKTFIPTLPFLVEVFDLTDINKKHKLSNFKPLNFQCMLKLSKRQLDDKSFKDGIIENLYDNFMEVFYIHSHTIGFPELALPAIIRLKKFVKTCKVAVYTKQMRQILEKVEATSNAIIKRRKTATLNLNDVQGVEAWERKGRESGNPLSKYYDTWRKLRDREIQFELTGQKEGGQAMQSSKIIETRKGGDDQYSDYDDDELEKLAGSASEDDDEEGRSVTSNDDDEEAVPINDEDIPDKADIVEDFEFSDED